MPSNTRRTTDHTRALHAAAQRRYMERNPEQRRDTHGRARAKWAQNNPEKPRAHRTVYRAIKRGQLTRPGRCERCLTDCKPEASHNDYGQPLQVEWLCRPCHARKDRRF